MTCLIDLVTTWLRTPQPPKRGDTASVKLNYVNRTTHWAIGRTCS